VGGGGGGGGGGGAAAGKGGAPAAQARAGAAQAQPSARRGARAERGGRGQRREAEPAGGAVGAGQGDGVRRRPGDQCRRVRGVGVEDAALRLGRLEQRALHRQGQPADGGV